MSTTTEILCSGCHMEATADRLDWGTDENGNPIYVCPVCGANMGPVPT